MVDLIIIEIPQVYPGGPKVDPNDLIKLALNAGRHMERLAVLFPQCPPRLGVYPARWKGQVKKDIHHRRVKTLIGPVNLAHAELCMGRIPAGKRHNVWDGIALGHWTIVQAMTGAKLGMSPYQTLKAVTDYEFRGLSATAAQ